MINEPIESVGCWRCNSRIA